MRRFWFFLIVVGLVGTSSFYLVATATGAACPQTCTGTADCSDSLCRTFMDGSDRWCYDAEKNATPGKVCKNATSGTCSDNQQVLCGNARWKKCATTGDPDCSPPFSENMPINSKGCL